MLRRCPPQYELIDKTCFKINPCLVNNGECSHDCINDKGTAKCACPSGFKLVDKTCIEENPCFKNNGGCSHVCQNYEGRPVCLCPKGYLLRPNKHTCKEVNECKINRGGCSHGCKNLPGSFECTCPTGLRIGSDKTRCVDINECSIENGQCQMQCINYKGGYKCTCDQGYTLQENGRTCKLITYNDCVLPHPPTGGSIRCSSLNNEPGTFVTPGTKCTIWCNEGYKLKGTSARVCQNSGTWSGEQPKCAGIYFTFGLCVFNKLFFSCVLSSPSSNTKRLASSEKLQQRIHLRGRSMQNLLQTRV